VDPFSAFWLGRDAAQKQWTDARVGLVKEREASFGEQKKPEALSVTTPMAQEQKEFLRRLRLFEKPA
jgi:hypothetical protein